MFDVNTPVRKIRYCKLCKGVIPFSYHHRVCQYCKGDRYFETHREVVYPERIKDDETYCSVDDEPGYVPYVFEDDAEECNDG